MSDLPARVRIHEEGPREGFQIESGVIATADKIRFIEALACTGVPQIDCVSYVSASAYRAWPTLMTWPEASTSGPACATPGCG
jgi:hypothetical protein